MHPQLKTHITQNKKKTKPRFGHLRRSPAWKWSGLILVERKGWKVRK